MARLSVVILEACGLLLNKSRMSTLRSHRYSSSTICKIDASQAMSWTSIRREAQARVQPGVCTIPGFHTWTCRVVAHNTGSRATTALRAGTLSVLPSVFLFSSSFCVPLGVAAVAAQKEKKKVRLSLRAPSAGLQTRHSEAGSCLSRPE